MALVRSKCAFAIVGDPVAWPAGRIVDASHPVAVRFPQHFQPVEAAAYDATVEQATAAPGEKRAVRPRSVAKKVTEG